MLPQWQPPTNPDSHGVIHMLAALPFPMRKECPPGACVCGRDSLSLDPDGDVRILRLTLDEEKKLVARIDIIASYGDLTLLQERLYAQLGIALKIAPRSREVRTVRGFHIELQERPGLCRKTRQAIPAAIRRCLERNPQIVYAILDAQDLFGAPGPVAPG